jgi:hypothetical protein
MRLRSYHGPVRRSLPQPWRLVSAHRNALNLALADGQLLCLVTPEVGNGPFTLVVEGALRLGPIPWKEGELGPIPWEEGALWEPPPMPPPSPSLGAALRRVVAHLRPACGALPVGSDSGELPGGLAGGALPVVLHGPRDPFGHLLRLGLEALQAGRWAEAVDRLVGLGPGLTPSGDDLLAGYVLAQRAICGLTRPGDRLQAVPAGQTTPLGERLQAVPAGQTTPLGERLRAIPASRTTPLGRHILRWAAEGVAAEHQMAWLAGFLAGDPDPPDRVMAIGATSGSDWLAGVLLAAIHTTGGELP